MLRQRPDAPFGTRLLPLARHTQRVHGIAHRANGSGRVFTANLISEVWKLATSIEIRPSAQIGQDVEFFHGQGVVIGGNAVVGRGSWIHQQVALGADGSGDMAMPTIGEHVRLYAGAKIIGAVTVGDHATVGANAVVNRDVAPGAIVVGAPARVVGWKDGWNAV